MHCAGVENMAPPHVLIISGTMSSQPGFAGLTHTITDNAHGAPSTFYTACCFSLSFFGAVRLSFMSILLSCRVLG